MRARARLGLTLLAAVLAGCPAADGPMAGADEPNGPAAPTTKTKEGIRVALTLTAEQKEDGVHVVLTNQSGQPGLVLVGESLVPALEGEGGALTVRGRIFMDDPGVQARAPRGDRSEFEGEATAVFAAAIADGGTWTGRLPKSDQAPRVKVLLASPATPLFRVDAIERIDAPPQPASGMAGGGGWVEVATLLLTAKPATEAGADAGEALSWPAADAGGDLAPGGVGGAIELPRVFRYGAWKKDVDASAVTVEAASK